jgi:hypothetical protein
MKPPSHLLSENCLCLFDEMSYTDDDSDYSYYPLEGRERDGKTVHFSHSIDSPPPTIGGKVFT